MKTKKERLRSPRNYVQTIISFEPIKDHVSLTVPDQTMSIRQLIDRSLLQPVPDSAFLGDDPELAKIADVDRMELTDRNEFGEQLASKTNAIGNRYKAEVNAEQKRKDKDALKKELEDEAKNALKNDPTKPGSEKPE